MEKIAQGGMAQVYKAKTVDPTGIERLVVIKRILPHISSDSEYIHMLIDEAKIAVHFTHGNIAQIYDLGKVGDDYFIVMEYVDGKTLGQVLREFKTREKPLPLDVIAYCISELCYGLDYMHRKAGNDGRPLGVVHRDISPQNIIVSYSGTVKLIDFGVAKAFEKLSHTQSGVLKGKFAYMSPEQAEGASLDRRSDIFSTGILLWEMLTGERLFKKGNNKDTLKAVKAAHVTPPSKYRRDIPPELDKIVEKSLRRKPEKRYQSAAEMGHDLERFLLKNNPDFSRVKVAEFLYRYFGPEPDEEGLPPELPELAIEKEKTVAQPIKPKLGTSTVDEEKTEIDWKKKWGGIIPQWVWILILFSAFIGGAVSAVVWYQKTNYGLLTITVDPPDSQVSMDDEVIPHKGRALSLKLKSGHEALLNISHEGYVSFESSYTLRRRQSRSITIKLEKEIPPFGTLFITTHPGGASIFLNDMEWNQKTPAEIPHLQSDKSNSVRLVLDGYETISQSVVLHKGERKVLNLTFKALFGIVEINTNPEGATVSIDDQVVGTTPFIDRRVDPSKPYNFELSMPGFRKLQQEVNVSAAENKKLLFDLQKGEN